MGRRGRPTLVWTTSWLISKPHIHSQSPNKEEREGNVEQEENIKTQPQQQKRLCDFCGESKALLYCRADSAKLCFHCDREVHSTNPLFTKHTRFQLCDLCDSNPASIHCSTENHVLCQNCDWESHRLSSSSSVHDRRPLEGFTGCPSAIELSSILGFEDLGDKSLLDGGGGGNGCLLGSETNGFSDLFVWETPSIFSLDDLIVSSDSSQNFPAMGIPPLPKNRNTACGKYKEDIIHQLHNMLNLETCWNNDFVNVESLLGLKPLVPEQCLQPGNVGIVPEHEADPNILPSYEANTIHWQGDGGEAANQNLSSSTFSGSYFEESFLVLDKPDDVGGSASDANGGHEKQSQHPIIPDTLQVVPKVAPRELTGQNRDSMISRYKEKRKTRRFDKHIRYESRKARAESRTRIKGRFAKVSN
ncbi:zinc finger protein [Macleaya cordata]|uniref:Zinc finger protein n=1 Tax=Macleaya cordata TaxID=56857 RepID=A0A200QX67_MACCD|nr:zinc finger protein [Macleaya cordata]